MAKKTKTTSTKTGITTAEFIKTKIKENKLEDKQILAAARKRAPSEKIGNHYVSWYRWQMKTAGKAPRLSRKNKGKKQVARKAVKAPAADAPDNFGGAMATA